MNMKLRYRLFLRRKSVYYAFDDTTKTFTSLKTKDKAEANRLLMALNEAGQQPAMNLSLARVYLRHSDPLVSTRTWQTVFDEIIRTKTRENQIRWQVMARSKWFDPIRNRLLIETVDEVGIAVQRGPRPFHRLRAMPAFHRFIERGIAAREAAGAEQIRRINVTARGARPHRQAVINDHAPALKRLDRHFAFAVGEVINQVQFAQRRFRRGMNRQRRQVVAAIAQLHRGIHEGVTVQPGRGGITAGRFRADGQLVRGRQRTARAEQTFQQRDDIRLIYPRPIRAHEVEHRIERIRTRQRAGQVIRRPSLRIVVDDGDILARRDFVHRQRAAVGQDLPGGRDVLPERHVHRLAAAGRQFVEMRIRFDDAALDERGLRRRPLQRVFFEETRNDNVGQGCFSHKSVFLFW
jgi:hypothetical protein